MVRVPPEKQKRKHLHCPFFPAKQAFSRSAQNNGFGRKSALCTWPVNCHCCQALPEKRSRNSSLTETRQQRLLRFRTD
jgi:hypothetical protein